MTGNNGLDEQIQLFLIHLNLDLGNLKSEAREIMNPELRCFDAGEEVYQRQINELHSRAIRMAREYKNKARKYGEDVYSDVVGTLKDCDNSLNQLEQQCYRDTIALKTRKQNEQLALQNTGSNQRGPGYFGTGSCTLAGWELNRSMFPTTAKQVRPKRYR